MNRFLNSLQRHPIQALFTLAALVLAFTYGTAAYDYVDFETSYDEHQEAADQIYRLDMATGRNALGIKRYATVPGPLAIEIFQKYRDKGVTPTRLYQTFQQTPVISRDGEQYYEERFFFADRTVFDVFDFTFVRGTPDKAFRDTNAVVLTETMVQKYFGEQDPMGKTITFEGELPLKVTGVIESWPENSHFHVDFLTRMRMRRNAFEVTGTNTNWLGSWVWNPYHTFVRLSDDWTKERFETEVLKPIVKEYRKPKRTDITATPLTSLHLSTLDRGNVLQGKGSLAVVYAVGIGALVLLVLAVLQLSSFLVTAREDAPHGTADDAAATGIVADAVSATGLCVAAGLLAALLMVPGTQAVAATLGKTVPFDGFAATGARLLGLVVVTGLLTTGLVAAGRLVSYRFLQVNTGLQAAVAVLVLVLAVSAGRQMQFVDTKPNGFDDDRLLSVPIKNNDALQDTLAAFRDAVEAQPSVATTTLSSAVPGQGNHISSGFRTEGKYSLASAVIYHVGDNFRETFGLDMTARMEDRSKLRSDLEGFTVNDSLSSAVGWSPSETIGKRFISGKFGVIAQVVKSFHFEPLYEPIDPMILKQNAANANFVIVRSAEGSSPSDIREDLGEMWSTYSPDRPLATTAVANDLSAHYEEDNRLVSLLSLLAVLAGGLVALFLGGRSIQLLRSGSARIQTEMIVPSLVGAALALPAGYVPLNAWIERFAYHVVLPAWGFGAAALACLVGAGVLIYRSGSASTRASEPPVPERPGSERSYSERPKSERPDSEVAGSNGAPATASSDSVPENAPSSQDKPS
jgi:putative ABC transport system permease protein